MNTEYIYVKVNPRRYNLSYKKHRLIMGIKSTCMPYKRHIKEAENLLVYFHNERRKLALLFYNVAVCARRIAKQKYNIKGIAIDFAKEDFCTDQLKNIQVNIANKHTLLKKKIRYARIGVIVGTLFFAMLCIGVMYPAIRAHHISMLFLDTVLFFMFILFIMMPIIRCTSTIDLRVNRRLQYVMDEECIKYFDNMYNRLQFVDTKDKKFLYNIGEGVLSNDEKSFYFSGNFCKVHKSRSLQKQPSLHDSLLKV